MLPLVRPPAARAFPNRRLKLGPRGSDRYTVSEDPQVIRDHLVLLDNKLKQLKMEYEQYFLGSRPREPAQLRGEVQKLVSRYSNIPIRNAELRFRFNNLSSRLYALRRQWDATLRKMERGSYERHVFKSRFSERRNAEASSVDPSPTSAERDLFSQYIAARERCGQDTTGFSRERLEQVLREQRVALQQRYGWREVRFHVAVEDGKTKLKAAPQNGTATS